MRPGAGVNRLTWTYDKISNRWPSLDAAKHSLNQISHVKFWLYVIFNEKIKKKTHLPAAKRVPLADPNVETVTERGISHAITPSKRFPKVTATASESTISVADITAKYERLIRA